MRKFLFLLLLVCTIFSSTLANAVQPNEPDQYVFVRVFADKTNVSGGETIRVGLEQIIHPQWHSYWKNPGDSGLATSIDWQLPEDFSVSNLEWPTPQKIPFGPLTNYGYEGRAVLLQNLTVPDDIGDTPIQLDGTVNLLVCHDICIPESHDVSLILNGTTPAEPEKIQDAESALPSKEINATYYAHDSNLILQFESEAFGNKNIQSVTLLPEEWGGIDNTVDAFVEDKENFIIVSQKRGDRDLQELPVYPTIISIAYTDGSNAVFKTNAFFKQPPSAATTKDTSTGLSGFLKAILFAFLGGIIVNLMPCVFPVLSMKALSLVNMKDEEEKQARTHGIAYTAGILTMFTIIGGVLLLLKAGGAQIGWGFQLQNPIIILGLAYLIFILALNMAGYFEFSSRFSGIGQRHTQASGKKGAFFTGVLATLVATPCTAPFMGAALGYALTQSAVISMAVFWALGFGLALPYLIITFIPALRKKLPRPGAWMESFRQFLSFPLFITAAWLVWVLSQQGNINAVFIGLTGMVVIAFVMWVSRHLAQGKIRIINSILLVLSILYIGTTFLQISKNVGDIQNIETKSINDTAETFSQSELNEILKGDDAVFTNMTAAWCITCKVNERIALKTNKITELFATQNIKYLKGDWTNKDAEITQYLNEFNRHGVPLYVFYGARNTISGERPAPVVLPQILTAGIVEKYLTQTSEGDKNET